MTIAEAASSLVGSRLRMSSAGLGNLQPPSSTLVDNILALISIGLVAIAATLAVQSWTEVTPVRMVLFALFYFLLRGLVRHLFEAQRTVEVTALGATLDQSTPAPGLDR